MIYERCFKRLLDIFFSLLFLSVTLPFLIIIALLIKLCSPQGSVLYKHKRIGKDGKLFGCLKFRTMVPDADQKLQQYLQENPAFQEEYQNYFKLKHDPRIIRGIGHFLRNTSFDELPQFINVLGGQMSIIGPRPIVEAEIPKYGDFFPKLISVKPGITGLWQISGRNDISYVERVALDMRYIDNINFKQDVIIAFKTIKVILLGKGY
jgi:lipopolysaccharide/colanic/teichoic acid biosynthesis glycosyltransferase